ncbi:CSC1-like protein 2 isoform X2 [Neocloeon triangulifer]|uniref:CSC1-like protein 2 isoform X2 n=1 Tax=Neocloeon triangulifer TaxID=2078957 RepID=UPI00286F3DB2|nr:CSC1-like protein 2 isoform X2 [Neocloeon triangulifer]
MSRSSGPGSSIEFRNTFTHSPPIMDPYEDGDGPADKCGYYRNNHTRIFTSVYEGIPENLLLNFLCWLVLMVLFAILRKRAWNYGRIALVQKSEERWTQLFYGNDVITSSSAPDAESVASVDSTLFVEKGFGSWLFAVFRIKDDDILRKSGPDAIQYLSFQRHVIFYMIIVTFISLAIVLPINFQGTLQGDEKTFGHTTVSNLSPDSEWLWAHVVLAVLYLPLGIFVMRRFSVSMHLEEEDSHVSRTLMITNIPRQYCDKDDLQKHFREAYPHIEVIDIQLAYNITKVSQLDKARETAAQAKVYCDNYIKNTGKNLHMRPHICGNVCCCCKKEVDALEYYSNEEERLSHAVEDEKEKALKKPLGVAFVTLSTIEEARQIYEDHTTSCKCAANPSSSSLSRNLQPHVWTVDFAPMPQDIYWENLSVSSNFWYLKATIIHLILFIVLFFLTTPAIVVNMLDSLNFSNELQKMSPVLSEFLPTLLLWTVAALMPVLVSYSDQWLSHWTRSKQNHSIMRKTFLFLLFMVIILPSLGLTSAQAFVEWALHQKNETYRWECLFLPDKGAFFVSYATTSAFVGTALELIRFPELFMYALKICLAKSAAETASVRKAILWEFPFGVQYAWMLLIFAMTIMYSLSCPLITPFGLLYLVLKHLVDRYNIYFAYGPSKISQSIHETAIICVIASIVLLQLSFMCISLLRLGLRGITIFSLAGLVLTILFMLSHIFLNCCKGFSPITYTRKSRRRQNHELANSQPTTPSRHFVPSVLQPPALSASRNTPGYGTQSADSVPSSPLDRDPEETLRFYQNMESRYEQV